jgi:hypothetical protein
MTSESEIHICIDNWENDVMGIYKSVITASFHFVIFI